MFDCYDDCDPFNRSPHVCFNSPLVQALMECMTSARTDLPRARYFNHSKSNAVLQFFWGDGGASNGTAIEVTIKDPALFRQTQVLHWHICQVECGRCKDIRHLSKIRVAINPTQDDRQRITSLLRGVLEKLELPFDVLKYAA